MKVLLTGGGSGGHLNTSLALAEYLQKHELEVHAQLVFVGGLTGMQGESTGSIESRRVPEKGIRFLGIRSGKLHRPINIKAIGQVFGALLGLVDAFKVISREKPDVVFSTGGFVTVPVVLAAFLHRVPIVIHEQTLTAGLANRIASKFARKVLVTFPQSQKGFSQKKVVHTGNPIRESRFTSNLPVGKVLEEGYKRFLKQVGASGAVDGGDAGSARTGGDYSTEKDKFIFLTGGGLGSHVLNVWASENLSQLAQMGLVLLQVGENSVNNDLQMLEKVRQSLPEQLQKRVMIVKWFGDEIGYIYTHADLVIARPGANTVLELLAREKKAVFVPIAWASGGEQQKNAEYFCANQTGKIVQQQVINQELLPAVKSLLSERHRPSAHLVNKLAVESIWEQIQAASAGR